MSAEHPMQYTDTVLQNCAPETYIILLTTVTPVNLIQYIFLKRSKGLQGSEPVLLAVGLRCHFAMGTAPLVFDGPIPSVITLVPFALCSLVPK